MKPETFHSPEQLPEDAAEQDGAAYVETSSDADAETAEQRQKLEAAVESALQDSKTEEGRERARVTLTELYDVAVQMEATKDIAERITQLLQELSAHAA